MKRLLPLLISFLLVSCASYTISEARNKIQYPEPVSISTRYSEIKEAEEKEEEAKKGDSQAHPHQESG